MLRSGKDSFFFFLSFSGRIYVFKLYCNRGGGINNRFWRGSLRKGYPHQGFFFFLWLNSYSFYICFLIHTNLTGWRVYMWIVHSIYLDRPLYKMKLLVNVFKQHSNLFARKKFHGEPYLLHLNKNRKQRQEGGNR